jgi:hypothetical protein
MQYSTLCVFITDGGAQSAGLLHAPTRPNTQSVVVVPARESAKTPNKAAAES